jgi:hypothetical protein
LDPHDNAHIARLVCCVRVLVEVVLGQGVEELVLGVWIHADGDATNVEVAVGVGRVEDADRYVRSRFRLWYFWRPVVRLINRCLLVESHRYQVGVTCGDRCGPIVAVKAKAFASSKSVWLEGTVG